jgi:hypothetical protein
MTEMGTRKWILVGLFRVIWILYEGYSGYVNSNTMAHGKPRWRVRWGLGWWIRSKLGGDFC